MALTMSKYETLKRQVLVYKQNMQAKVDAIQVQMQRSVGITKDEKAQNVKFKAELDLVREEFEKMQLESEQKETRLASTLQARIVESKIREVEERKRSKIEADRMIRTHPRYPEILNMDFFRDFRNSDLAQVLNWVEWRDCKAAETVVVEGERDIIFYLVVTGKLAVRKGAKIMHVLQPGEPFGEIAFLDDENSQRSATVKARTDCTLLCLNPAQLDSAEVMIRMRVAEALVRIQAKRLRRTMGMVENLLADVSV